MTIDERIEALTARHEALTQSVELLPSFHRDTEAAMRATDARIDKLLDITETISKAVIQYDQRLRKLEGNP